MKIMKSNLQILQEEFVEIPRRTTQTESPVPELMVSTDSHTDNGVNYVMLTLTHTGSRNRQHMGIALDFSNSMSQLINVKSKKTLLIEATQTALTQMNDDDCVTVVVYGSHAECVLEKVRVGHPETIPSIVRKLRAHEYMGMTNPASALHLLKECDQTLFLSDGQFNEGPTSPDILHGIVKHSLLCGSIFPGTDMSELAKMSEGTYFNLNCESYEEMQTMLASSLSAPPIVMSNVVLTSDTTHKLPSIRAGCSIRYVFKAFGDSITVEYMDEEARIKKIESKLEITGAKNGTVERVLALQSAAELAEEAFRTNNKKLRLLSANMFKNAGIPITSDDDMRRVSSSQLQQFSVDPDDMHTPETCREASYNAKKQADDLSFMDWE